jgi:SAM-dependent methyltransferase
LFKKKIEKTEMAFGKIPAYCKYELFMERYRSASDFIKEYHKGKDKINILDVGCGEGYLKYFCDFGKIEWHGVEIWKERFELCKTLGYNMHPVDVDTQKMPFADGEFDVVVGSHVLEHLKNRKFVVEEIYRVVKIGGIIILAVPVKPPLINIFLNFFWGLSAKAKGETVHAFTLYTFKKFLETTLDKKFNLIDVRGFRFISARKRFNWENSIHFYKANTWFGRTFPALTPEINVVLLKKS